MAPWEVAGITPQEAKALSGVWDYIAVRERLAKAPYIGEQEDFSWGRGQYILNGSTIIDLGAKPPYISLPLLVEAQVVSARSKDGHRYALQCRSLVQGDDTPSLSLSITLNDDGTLNIEGTVGLTTVSGEGWHLFKSSGPGVK